MTNNTEYVAVLDVESLGLYGDHFSYGLVIGDKEGNIVEEIYKYSENDSDIAIIRSLAIDDLNWVKENVIPHVGESNSNDIIKDFYKDYLYLLDKYPGIKLYGDVIYPVETSFIEQVVLLNIKDDELFKFSPYPIFDIASFREAWGLPFYYPRLENELPEHNALNDARQSYRGLVEVFTSIKDVGGAGIK